jgi:PAS domain S-box-containing protein
MGEIIEKKKREGQLINELSVMRQRLGELESSEAEHRKVVDKLLRDKLYYESLLYNMHEDIMIIDRDYRITDVTKAFLVTTGHKREEVIGRHCYEVSHGYDEPCENRGEQCLLLQVFETGRPSSCRHRHVHADGSKVWVDLLLSPARDDKGKVTHVIETIRDVTELVNAEKAVYRSQRLASVGRLAAEIAHEMNNPLTSILTFCKLARTILNKEPFSLHRLSELRDYISYLHNETERCANISRDLLDFSRQGEIEIRDNNIDEILDKTLAILQHGAEMAQVEIHTVYAPKLPLLSCDFKRLQQAFVNIIGNGIEAMPEGGTLTVSTSYDQEKDMVRVDISDTGVGIAEENVEKIFEPFFTTKAEGRGLGLGLSVAYGIIRQHQGEVHIKSILGKGSHFTIHLPAGKRN